MSPAVVVSQSSPSSSKDVSRPARRSGSASAHPRARKTRAIRRRRGARPGMIDSDDEIERETMSDASDTDDLSPSDSGSDSEPETEAESLVLHNGRHHPDTPSTTQSPPPGEVEALNGFASKPGSDVVGASQPSHSGPAFFDAGADWSEIVATEGTDGPSELPVIDFSELHEHAGDEAPRLTNQDHASVSDDGKGKETGTSSPHSTERPLRGEREGHRGASRLPGRSARQVYQQRLQSDPSFVPRVGEFWSHDDRLMQKDLRSMSDWWRGRWQGRGRGRGAFVTRGMRGRGRGGFFGSSRSVSNDGNPVEDERDNIAEDSSQPNLPPVEKPWTHDGFEELKAKEEQRRTAANRRAIKSRPGPPSTVNGVTSTTSRGGFTPRGRGSFRGTPSPTPSRMSYVQRLRSQPDRPWFTMKPEHVWTKQFEGFLFSDPSLKQKHGKNAAYRVSLPGKGTEIIRAPAPDRVADDGSELRSQLPSEAIVTSDLGSRMVVVRLPKLLEAKEASLLEEESPQPAPLVTVEDIPVEVSASHSALELSPAGQSNNATNNATTQAAGPEQHPASTQVLAQDNVMATPALTRDDSLSEKSVGDIVGGTAPAGQSALESEKHLPEMVPVLPAPIPPPPIQTSFPPPLQPTPTYSPAPAPYAYPPLPPGFALNQQGFAYEVASGRPVFLHPTPPPQIPMYNPRPIPFMPGHMHHHSMSGEFMQAPPTPPITGMLDLSTGQPLFSLPRQNSRIEIRAPSDANDGLARGKREHRPSNLRSVTVVGQLGEVPQEQQQVPSVSVPPGYPDYTRGPEYYPPGLMGGIASQPSYQSSEGTGSLSPGGDAPAQSQQPSMMGYPPYQQQYYYPEQYYPAYVEMPQQAGQYDPYNTDPRQQPQVYYGV